ncbi:MAG: hypothetical protein K2Q14_04515 [Gammaproteobacteria bacterium]|nr:hypothetical protein [Gammaproteobacteria bacterium]
MLIGQSFFNQQPKNAFFIKLKYGDTPLNLIDVKRDEHINFLNKYYEKGVFLA